ncbi:unnamed protein product [Mycena citricolor]|uniref:Uncharacterized protein n=1 Tax=Mycena citricolor TaxID=2018698 RepID=A0AAD2HJW5_9AGAR|nr:unnamed protein product [Mycena citricolor]
MNGIRYSSFIHQSRSFEVYPLTSDLNHSPKITTTTLLSSMAVSRSLESQLPVLPESVEDSARRLSIIAGISISSVALLVVLGTGCILQWRRRRLSRERNIAAVDLEKELPVDPERASLDSVPETWQQHQGPMEHAQTLPFGDLEVPYSHSVAAGPVPLSEDKQETTEMACSAARLHLSAGPWTDTDATKISVPLRPFPSVPRTRLHTLVLHPIFDECTHRSHAPDPGILSSDPGALSPTARAITKHRPLLVRPLPKIPVPVDIETDTESLII